MTAAITDISVAVINISVAITDVIVATANIIVVSTDTIFVIVDVATVAFNSFKVSHYCRLSCFISCDWFLLLVPIVISFN